VTIGIGRENRKDVTSHLGDIHSETFRLLIKRHVYHWNVVGPLFHSLHEMLEEQCNDTFAATDEIVERIRALGFLAPIDLAATTKCVTHPSASASAARGMVEDLILDHDALVRKIVQDAADRKDV